MAEIIWNLQKIVQISQYFFTTSNLCNIYYWSLAFVLKYFLFLFYIHGITYKMMKNDDESVLNQNY